MTEIAIYSQEGNKFVLEKMRDFDFYEDIDGEKVIPSSDFFFDKNDNKSLLMFNAKELFKVKYDDETNET